MVPLTNEDKILTKNSPDLNPVDYSAWCIVTKFQTLTSWKAC